MEGRREEGRVGGRKEEVNQYTNTRLYVHMCVECGHTWDRRNCIN